MDNLIKEKINIFFTPGALYESYLDPYASILVVATTLIIIGVAIFMAIKNPFKIQIKLINFCFPVLLAVIAFFSYVKGLDRHSDVKIVNDVALISYMAKPNVEIHKDDVNSILANRVVVKKIRSSMDKGIIYEVYCSVDLEMKNGEVINLSFTQPDENSHFCQRL